MLRLFGVGGSPCGGPPSFTFLKFVASVLPDSSGNLYYSGSGTSRAQDLFMRASGSRSLHKTISCRPPVARSGERRPQPGAVMPGKAAIAPADCRFGRSLLIRWATRAIASRRKTAVSRRLVRRLVGALVTRKPKFRGRFLPRMSWSGCRIYSYTDSYRRSNAR
jgi:hypothetical protein